MTDTLDPRPTRRYEELPEAAAKRRIAPSELSRIVDFVEQFEDESDAFLGGAGSGREMRIMIHLMRNHLAGRLVTPSSLIAASGMSYGSGSRAVNGLIERGAVIRRPRTRSGRSFSLHPSETTLEAWRDYARRIKTLIGGAFGWAPGPGRPEDYFFGASYMCAQVIRPPSVMPDRLALSGKLRLLIHADPTFMAMKTAKQQFENLFGAPVSHKALSIDRLRLEILANAERNASQYDVVAVDLPWFGELASKGVIRPLDDLFGADRRDLSDFHPEAVSSARWNGAQYGVPVQTTPELFVHRTDLFERAGLDPPATTADLLVAARALHDPLRGLSGVAWNGARGTPLGHSFLMFLGAFGRPIIDLEPTEDGFRTELVEGRRNRPMLDTEAALRTVEFMLELMEVSPPTVLNMSWFERARCYAEGAAATAYCYTLLAPLFERDPTSPAHGVTGFGPHPRAPGATAIAPLGGYALAIPSNLDAERVEPAWRALRTLTSPEVAKLYVVEGSSVSPRFSLGGDPDVAALSPVIPIVDEMARTGVLQHWPRPPIPELPAIIALTGNGLLDLLYERGDPKPVLARLQNAIDAMMREAGRY